MADLQVLVYRVHIPPMSTIGYGYGHDEEGNHVEFAGDHRPMRDLGEALAAGDDQPTATVPDWAVVSITPKETQS